MGSPRRDERVLIQKRSTMPAPVIPKPLPPMALAHGGELSFGAPLVMGIVNVTPDSFSDGGRFAQCDRAVAHALELVREGAAILDIGGESTRPAAPPVTAGEEMARVLPVIRLLRQRTHVPISVDTAKAEVAAASLAAGASMVNDVWGFQRDPDLPRVTARAGAAAILMHNRGHDNVEAQADIVAEVLDGLAQSIAVALRAGMTRRQIIVDPGFGFGKTDIQNFRLIGQLGQFTCFACPILLGVSRKSSIGRLTGEPDALRRLPGSLAAALAGVAAGANIVRVHDVAAHVQALDVAAAITAQAAL